MDPVSRVTLLMRWLYAVVALAAWGFIAWKTVSPEFTMHPLYREAEPHRVE